MLVYVIYADEDEAFVEELRRELAEYDIQIQTSQTLVGGVDWRQAATDAIRGCDAVVIIVSKGVLETPYALEEMAIAEQSGKTLFSTASPEYNKLLPLLTVEGTFRVSDREHLIDTLLETLLGLVPALGASRGIVSDVTAEEILEETTEADKAEGAEIDLPTVAGADLPSTLREVEVFGAASGGKAAPPAPADEEKPEDEMLSPGRQRGAAPQASKLAPSPPVSEPGQAPSREVKVSVGGDVSGQVTVAGGDVHIHRAGPEQVETRDQPRKFEAAFPQEVHKGTEEKLWVAVRLPDAPSAFAEEQESKTSETDAIPIPMPVDNQTGQLKPVDVEVAVTAMGFRVIGDSKKTLTVWPDGRTVKRWFVLEAIEEGPQEIMLEISHQGRLLAEITVGSRVYTLEKKPRALLNLSLQIASFTLQFSFAGA